MMIVESDEEAIKLANDTSYGLQASLFTSSVTKAHKYGRALQAGTVSVNCYGEGDISTPFGGYKLSGFGVEIIPLWLMTSIRRLKRYGLILVGICNEKQ